MQTTYHSSRTHLVQKPRKPIRIKRAYSTQTHSKAKEVHKEFQKVIAYNKQQFDMSWKGLLRGTGDATVDKPEQLVALVKKLEIEGGEYLFTKTGDIRAHEYLALQDNTPSKQEQEALPLNDVLTLCTHGGVHALSWSSNFAGGSVMAAVKADKALFHLVRRNLKSPSIGYDPVIVKHLKSYSSEDSDVVMGNITSIMEGLPWEQAFRMDETRLWKEMPDWVLNYFTAYTQYEVGYLGSSHAVDGLVIHGRLTLLKPHLRVLDFRYGLGGGIMPILSGVGNNLVAYHMWERQFAGMRKNILNPKLLEVTRRMREQFEKQERSTDLSALFRQGVVDLGEAPVGLGAVVTPLNALGSLYRRGQSVVVTPFINKDDLDFGAYKNKSK